MSAPVNRRMLRKMYWQPPLRNPTILMNVGIVLAGAAAYYWIFFGPTVRFGSPLPWAQLIPVAVVGLAGVGLVIGALGIRNRRLVTLLPRPCLQCGTLNPREARFCSHCGAVFGTA